MDVNIALSYSGVLLGNFFALVGTRENLYHCPNVYVLPMPLMDNRSPIYLVFALVLCLFLPSSGTGQDLIYVPPEEHAWGNPYPGLGNVHPSTPSGPRDPFASLPQARILYPGEEEHYSALLPTMRSSEIYLSRHPNNKRTGVFQKVNFNTLWSPKAGSKGLGMTELDLSAMFALPLPTRDSPLLITPKFTTTFFDSTHWNETFYTTGLALRWIRPIVKNKLTADIGFSALYSGDFKARAGDALRFPIHVAGVWDFNPRTKIVLGVVYTDRRDNYNVFPMAGLIWTPNDEVSVELLVPRLRVAQRIRWFGSAAGDEQSDWLYTAFEFGSGSWGYEPLRDRVEYSDLRLLMGYERRTRFGLTLGLEVGYMFDRKLSSGQRDTHPSDSVFLRVRSSF